MEIISAESEKMYKYCVTNGRNINSTDECYTPSAVYDTVLDYAVERYNLQGIVLHCLHANKKLLNS